MQNLCQTTTTMPTILELKYTRFVMQQTKFHGNFLGNISFGKQKLYEESLDANWTLFFKTGNLRYLHYMPEHISEEKW